MVLFGMSQIGSLLLVASFATCIVLVIYALSPFGSRPKDQPPARRLAWVLLAPLEFAALWPWLTGGIGILIWLLVFGDNMNERLHNIYIRTPATMIAVVTSVVVALRLARGAASRRFARIHLWGSVVLLLTYGALHGYDYVSRIEGTTAQRAAENIMARYYPAHVAEGQRLVERNFDLDSGIDPTRSKCYYFMVGNEPTVRITVHKIGRLAWALGSSRPVLPSGDRIERAKQAIKENDPDLAEFILKEVIDDYPETAAESEARELLESLPRNSPA
jgi:hypothetical protein